MENYEEDSRQGPAWSCVVSSAKPLSPIVKARLDFRQALARAGGHREEGHGLGGSAKSGSTGITGRCVERAAQGEAQSRWRLRVMPSCESCRALTGAMAGRRKGAAVGARTNAASDHYAKWSKEAYRWGSSHPFASIRRTPGVASICPILVTRTPALAEAACTASRALAAAVKASS